MSKPTNPRAVVATVGLSVLLLLSAVAAPAQDSAENLPEHAQPTRYGGGWECIAGYRKADEPQSEGPWIAGNNGAGVAGGTQGGWLCWAQMGPGLWDLSDYAVDVSEIRVTGSAISPGSFSIDDMHVNIRY